MVALRSALGLSVLLAWASACGGAAPRALPPEPCTTRKGASLLAEPASVAGLVDGPGAVATCPRRSTEAPPGVHVVTSPRAALPLLEGVARAPQDRLDLAALRREKGDAFFVDVPGPFFQGSHARRGSLAAVLVDGPRTVVVPRLVATSTVVPPPCGAERLSAGIAARVLPVKAAAKSKGWALGHVRVLRAGVPDEPTLPSVNDPPDAGRRDPGCRVIERFRIEDHFVRLDSGEPLVTLAQTFEASRYGPPLEPLPGVPFEAFALDGASADDGDAAREPGGVVAGECRARFVE